MASVSSYVNPSQRIPALERLGGRRRRRRTSCSRSTKADNSRTSEGNELFSEGESEKTIPPPPARDPQVNVVRVAHSGASIRNGAREGGGRPPFPPNKSESGARSSELGPRTSVFDRISVIPRVSF